MLIKTPFSVFCSYDKHFFHPWFRLVDFAHILAAAMKLCPEEKTEKKQQIKRVKITSMMKTGSHGWRVRRVV